MDNATEPSAARREDGEPARWRIQGDWRVHCNCAIGCPCNFGSDPTLSHCEGGC